MQYLNIKVPLLKPLDIKTSPLFRPPIPFNIFNSIQCIKYWLSLITMDGQRYPKQCYIMLRRLQMGGRLTWCSKVKNMLFQYGFGYA